MQNNTDVTVQTDSPVENRFTVETNVVPENVEPEKVEPTTEKPTEVETTDSEPDEEPTEQKSINPRTAQRKAEKERLIRENAVLAEKLRQYEQEKATDSDEPKARDLSKEPNPSDYDDVLEYTRDVARYDRKQESQQAETQKQTEALAQRAEIVRAEKPDYDEKVVGLIESRLITPDIEREILSSPISADVAYHLAEYGADLMTLRGLPAEALPKAIKAIEAFIKKGGEPQEKPKITKAEPPITPPGVTANAHRPLSSYSQQEIEDMPLSQFNRL
jgi:hypothetical protein